jgi:DNA polymerase-3 subunit delta
VVKGVIAEYMQSPADFSVLVIINEKSCDTLKKLSGLCVVDCNRADAGTLVRWVKGECSNNGVTIEAETAKLIVDYCLSDMTRIENETKKLCSYVGENGEIVKETIELLVARDTEYKIYEMTDYIAKRKFDLAISVIKDMMSKGETSQRILVAVYNYYRRLLHSAISDMSLTELAEVFGIKEFAAKKTKEQASLFKKRALKSAVDGLSDADYKIKSGVADADEQMWLTIFKIMTDR